MLLFLRKYLFRYSPTRAKYALLLEYRKGVSGCTARSRGSYLHLGL